MGFRWNPVTRLTDDSVVVAGAGFEPRDLQLMRLTSTTELLYPASPIVGNAGQYRSGQVIRKGEE